MAKILVIAEKPSVGRDIARVLGCKKKEDGCLVGKDYIVSWAIGHLVTLAEPEDYEKEWKKWDANTLPMLPQSMKLKSIAQTTKQLKRLRELMNDTETDSIICATDSGREGELIFRYIYRITKCQKPFSRLWISSMTDIAIKEGFAKLKRGDEYDDLYLSAKCRSEADWLVGMNATRAYSLRYGTLLSIGRVQTPTLSMIVTRQKEMNAFDAKNYFPRPDDQIDSIIFDDSVKSEKKKVTPKKIEKEASSSIKKKPDSKIQTIEESAPRKAEKVDRENEKQEKSVVKKAESSSLKQGKKVPPMDELVILNVHALRRIARSFDDFPIKGRDISKANRAKLLDHFKSMQ